MKEVLIAVAFMIVVCVIVGLMAFNISRVVKKNQSLQQQALEEWLSAPGTANGCLTWKPANRCFGGRLCMTQSDYSFLKGPDHAATRRRRH